MQGLHKSFSSYPSMLSADLVGLINNFQNTVKKNIKFINKNAILKKSDSNMAHLTGLVPPGFCCCSVNM